MGQTVIYTVGRVIADLYARQSNVPLDAVQSFERYVGGSSANTAVGLARLGNDVGLIARVGTDPMGDFILNKLAEERVDTTMVQKDPMVSTGMAFAALFPPNDSEVWFCGVPNANAELSVHDIDEGLIAQAKVLVIAGTELAREPGRTATLNLIEMAKRWRIPIIVDVDWRPVFWQSVDEALDIYPHLLRSATVVLANEPELELVSQTVDVEIGCGRLLDLGVSEVIAKRGGEGSWFYSNTEKFHWPAFSVDVVNTLGAGDGFAAGYVHGYVAGWQAMERLRWASACGALVVTRHSCSEAMPRCEEVTEFLQGVGGETDV